MKIRHGFVSNSSSTSFCIVMSEDQEKIWMDSLNEYEKQVVAALERDIGKQIGELKVIVFSGCTGNYCFYEDIDLEKTEDDIELSDKELKEKYNIDEDWGGLKTGFWESAKDKLPENIVYVTYDL